MKETSDNNGHFIFRNVTVGSYNITDVMLGYDTIVVNVTVGENATNKLGDVKMVETNTSTTSGSDDNSLIIGVVALTAFIVIGGIFYTRRKPKP